MKVLYIINSLKRGGAEVLVSQIVPAMKKKNIEVDLLLLDNTNTSIIDNLRDQNVNILSSPVNIGSHNPLWIYYLKDFIPNYDIIHVHLFPANYWSILFKILFRSKMKYVLTIHSTMTRRWKNPLFRFLEKHILQKYDKLVVVSDQAKYNLDKFITKFDTVEVILNGIDLLKIKNAKPISLGYLCKGEENIYIAMVARFDYPKDQPTLIKSLLHLPDKYKLILIGEGENIEKCRKMVFDLTLDNRVYFLGVRDDVPQILKSVNVIVMSSLYEGLSLSSIEGLASGIPFIASDVDGLREVVENNGLLFPPGDDKKLAETILSVIDNTEFANEIVTRSLLNVEKYSLDNMVKEYYELYKKLV